MLMRKDLVKHPNYCVSNVGVVYRTLLPGLYSVLEPDLSNGYARVDLDGKKEYIARLVLEAFKPVENSDELKAFYIDGDPMNCNLSNLIWATPSEVQLYSKWTVEYRKEKLGGGAS